MTPISVQAANLLRAAGFNVTVLRPLVLDGDEDAADETSVPVAEGESEGVMAADRTAETEPDPA